MIKITYVVKLENDPTAVVGDVEKTFQTKEEMFSWEEEFQSKEPGKVIYQTKAEVTNG